jgi:preprotein translocase subunit YajC
MSLPSANAPVARGAAVARGLTSNPFGRLALMAPVFLMMASPAFAATAPAAGGGAGGMLGGLLSGPQGQLLLFVPVVLLFYVLIMRPQQRRAKEHRAMVEGLKRGDIVVLSNGVIGKVTRVEDKEAMVEIATGVNVRVVRSMVTEVRAKGEPAAPRLVSPKPAAKSAKTAKS